MTADSLLCQHSYTDIGATNFPLKVLVVIFLRHLGVIQTNEQRTCWRSTIIESLAVPGDCENSDKNLTHFALKLCCPHFKSS